MHELESFSSVSASGRELPCWFSYYGPRFACTRVCLRTYPNRPDWPPAASAPGRRSAASDEAATLAPSVTATTHAHAAGCPTVGATSWKLHGGHSHRLVYRNAILEEPRARTLAGTLSAARGSAVARTPWYSNWCVGLWHRDQRGYTQHLGRSSRRRKRRAVHNGCVRHRGWHRHALPRW